MNWDQTSWESTCSLSDHKTHLLPSYNLKSYNSIQFIWVLGAFLCKSANAAKERRNWSLMFMTEPDTSAAQHAKELVCV